MELLREINEVICVKCLRKLLTLDLLVATLPLSVVTILTALYMTLRSRP